MPVIGQRAVENNSYNKCDKYLPILEEFKSLNESIISESGVGLDSSDVYRNDIAKETLKQWFIDESYDVNDDTMTPEEVDDHVQMMGEIFENNKEEALNRGRNIMSEATSLASVNPTIGFSLLMHKNLLLKSVFAQGIPRSVAVSPRFTKTFMREYLVTPKGERFDIALEQDKLTDAMMETIPSIELELKLPELANTDIMDKLRGTKVDKLSIDSYISKIKVEVEPAYEKAHPELVSGPEPEIFTDDDGLRCIWIDVNLPFTAAAYTADFDRSLTAMINTEIDGIAKPITIGGNNITEDIINANLKVDGAQKVYITSATGMVKAIKLKTKVDASMGTIETCSTDYKTEDRLFEIPEGVPISTTVTPDIVQDIKALYNLNHVSMIMDQTIKILDNYKDDTIKKYLDNSFKRLNGRFKVEGNWDMKPRTDYAQDVTAYRKASFMDMFESYGTQLLNALNDPDVSFSVFGRPDIIRRLTPTECTYSAPSSIGSVTLDFTKNIYTSNKRNYKFLSSRKLKDNYLRVVVNPNNGNRRSIYNLYEYCFYMGNEIRNVQNPNIPNLHAYERFLISEYQPVQGRIEILNPTGYDKPEWENL